MSTVDFFLRPNLKKTSLTLIGRKIKPSKLSCKNVMTGRGNFLAFKGSKMSRQFLSKKVSKAAELPDKS